VSRGLVRFSTLGIPVLLLPLLSGCVPLLLGGAAAGSGYVAGQERGPVTTARDAAIKAKVADNLATYNKDLPSQVNLSVYDGRVLITGLVSNPEWQAEAGRLAWQVDGVKEVYNEVDVASKSTLADATRDSWITTRLRNSITFDSQIRSLNYSIDTVNGVVYLNGSARSQGEIDRVTDYARNIPNVRRVVNYVRIRTGEPQTAAPASPPPPAAPAPVVTPSATAAPRPAATPVFGGPQYNGPQPGGGAYGSPSYGAGTPGGGYNAPPPPAQPYPSQPYPPSAPSSPPGGRSPSVEVTPLPS
jgi:osmotically-inducible protein OsmY